MNKTNYIKITCIYMYLYLYLTWTSRSYIYCRGLGKTQKTPMRSRDLIISNELMICKKYAQLTWNYY